MVKAIQVLLVNDRAISFDEEGALLLGCRLSNEILEDLHRGFVRNGNGNFQDWKHIANLLNVCGSLQNYMALWHVHICQHCQEKWNRVIKLIMENDHRFLLAFYGFVSRCKDQEKIYDYYVDMLSQGDMGHVRFIEKFSNRKINFVEPIISKKKKE